MQAFLLSWCLIIHGYWCSWVQWWHVKAFHNALVFLPHPLLGPILPIFWTTMKLKIKQAHFCSFLLRSWGSCEIFYQRSECADTASWLNNQFIVRNWLNIGELLTFCSLFREQFLKAGAPGDHLIIVGLSADTEELNHWGHLIPRVCVDEICIILEDKGQEGAYHASKADGRRYESVLNLVNRTGVSGSLFCI